MDEKKVLKYYYSFYDVSKELNDKQFRLFNMAIFEVMFYEKHIDSIIFKDTLLNVLWKSIKHSLKSSIDGYCGKKGIDYKELFTPLINPLGKGVEENQIPLANNVNGNGNGNGKVNREGGGEEVKKVFTFNLPNKQTFDNLSKEYVSKLNEYIIKQPYDLTFEHFRDSCLAGGYKYKNFSLAYLTWSKKDNNQSKQPQPTQHYAERLGYIV